MALVFAGGDVVVAVHARRSRRRWPTRRETGPIRATIAGAVPRQRDGLPAERLARGHGEQVGPERVDLRRRAGPGSSWRCRGPPPWWRCRGRCPPRTARPGPAGPQAEHGERPTSARRSRLAAGPARRLGPPCMPSGVIMPPRCRARSRPSRRLIVRPAACGDLRVVGDDDDGRAVGGSARRAARGCPSPVAVSRLPVGSSARMMAGRPTRARAMATRWHSPPDSSPGRWAGPVAPGRPRSSASAAARRRCDGGHAPVQQAVGHVVERGQAGHAGRTAGRRTRSGSPGSPDRPWSDSPSTASPATRTRPDGRALQRAGDRPAASTCPTRTGRRSRRTRPCLDREA